MHDVAHTLRPSGDLDLLTIDDLRRSLATTIDTTTGDIVIDLTGVEHVDVVALSAILAAADAMREQGRSLRVAAARRELRRVCALLHAEDILLRDPEPDIDLDAPPDQF